MQQPNIECEIKFRFLIKDRQAIEHICESIAVPSSVMRYWILDFRFNQQSTGIKGKKSYERIRKQKTDGVLSYMHTVKKVDESGNTKEMENEIPEAEAELIIRNNAYDLYKKERLECSVLGTDFGIEHRITLAVDVMPIQKQYCYVECEVMLNANQTDCDAVRLRLADFMRYNFGYLEHIQQF